MSMSTITEPSTEFKSECFVSNSLNYVENGHDHDMGMVMIMIMVLGFQRTNSVKKKHLKKKKRMKKDNF
jgi:hypothetical protein